MRVFPGSLSPGVCQFEGGLGPVWEHGELGKCVSHVEDPGFGVPDRESECAGWFEDAIAI